MIAKGGLSYQGKKMQDELGMQLYDFHARQYDPQIGKFWGVDPADQFPSGYTGMGNDPANKIDPTGMYTLNRSQPWAHRKWSDRYAPLPVYENDKDRHMDFEGTDMAAENPFVLGYFSRQGDGEPKGAADYLFAKMGLKSRLKSKGGKGGGDEGGNKNVGETTGVLGAAIPIALTAAAVDGPIPAGDIVGGAIIVGAVVYEAATIKFVTYTLTNPTTGQIYVGRTRGYGDPQSIMMNRFYGHEKRKEGFENPQLDRVGVGIPIGYDAIRGREQDLVDSYGGIGNPRVANKINPISFFNPNRLLYLGASYLLFGHAIKQ